MGVREIVKILNTMKRKAFEEGVKGRTISPKEIPDHFKGGNYAEIAVMGILGKLDNFYKNYYDIDMDISFDYHNDMNNSIDLTICGFNIDIKSKYLTQEGNAVEAHDVMVVYNRPGMWNLMQILKHIDEIHYIPNIIVKDINYIWEIYMSYSTMKSENISYNNLMGKDLDNFSIYVEEVPLKLKDLLKSEYHMLRTRKSSSKTIDGQEPTGEFFTIEQASIALNIKTFELYKMITSKKITVYRLDDNLHISTSAIEKYILDNIAIDIKSTEKIESTVEKNIEIETIEKPESKKVGRPKTKLSNNINDLDTYPDVLGSVEVGEILGRSRNYVQKLIDDGELEKVHKHSGKGIPHRILKSSLIDYIERNKG